MLRRVPLADGLPRRCDRRHVGLCRAFTLIEVVLTLAILTLLIALVSPRFDRSARHRSVQSAARLLIADLEWARMAARAQSRPVAVEFNSPPGNAGGWCIVGLPDGKLVIRRGSGPTAAAIVHAGLSDHQGQSFQRVEFDAAGIPHVSGKVEIASGTVRCFVEIESPAAVFAVSH